LVKNQDSGISRVANEVTLEALHNPNATNGPTPSLGWGEKVACVAATLGIAYWVASLITGVCGATCATAVTNPVSAGLCAACVTAYVAVGTGSVAVLFKCFTL
jgi:hypothetical protein